MCRAFWLKSGTIRLRWRRSITSRPRARPRWRGSRDGHRRGASRQHIRYPEHVDLPSVRVNFKQVWLQHCARHLSRGLYLLSPQYFHRWLCRGTLSAGTVVFEVKKKSTRRNPKSLESYEEVQANVLKLTEPYDAWPPSTEPQPDLVWHERTPEVGQPLVNNP